MLGLTPIGVEELASGKLWHSAGSSVRCADLGGNKREGMYANLILTALVPQKLTTL